MLHILALLFFAAAASGALSLIADTLVRDQARIVDALRMSPLPSSVPMRHPLARVTRVRSAASPRPERALAVPRHAAA